MLILISDTKKATGMGTPGAVGQGMPDPINALQTLARQGVYVTVESL